MQRTTRAAQLGLCQTAGVRTILSIYSFAGREFVLRALRVWNDRLMAICVVNLKLV